MTAKPLGTLMPEGAERAPQLAERRVLAADDGDVFDPETRERHDVFADDRGLCGAHVASADRLRGARPSGTLGEAPGNTEGLET